MAPRMSSAQLLAHLLKCQLPSVTPLISMHGSHSEAAVACILRIHSSLPIQQIIPTSHDTYDISVLFIKRAIKSNDTWSGHIAFPGGHLNKGENDYSCAIRETMEEIGLDLQESDHCKWLGRLPQKAFQKRKRRLVILPHVFLLSCKEPSLKLCAEEVSEVRWVNLKHILSRGKNELEHIEHNIVELLRLRGMWRTRASTLCRLLNAQTIYFPSINLNIEYENNVRRDICPADTTWVLWGMTYGILHDLLTICNGDSRYFHSPVPFWFDNRIINCCIRCWSVVLQGRGSRNLFTSLVLGTVVIVYMAPILLVMGLSFRMFHIIRN